MTKKLDSYTIVPPHLYVERAADRQVERILQHMGRPGYVLVARQMGKTNLLLNAKKKYANSRNIFAYLDLSNTFVDVRSFFRNIVNVVVENCPDDLESLAADISKNRERIVEAPHKEHERELRTILRALGGKLVICLDEIDALTRIDYSDQVFSFVRSIYFSGRSNFEELNSLTYLLSGVAEPADIIKNRDVSPFNIGEKIILDDFSELEVWNLLSKAGIHTSEEVKKRIFYWTNGHPRMTWDVCSLLEDKMQHGPATIELVDQLVKEIYFGELEFPPVDQIKKNAEEMTEVRDSLVAIHYGRGDSIPDTLRTKLYLIGVSRLAVQGGAVEFKNKILEEALSEDFLRSLSVVNEISPLKRAEVFVAERRFDDAIGILQDILSRGMLKPDAEIAARNLLGTCFFFTANYSSAEVSIASTIHMMPDTAKPVAEFLMGVTLFRLGKYREANELLRKIAESSDETNLQYAHVAEAKVDWAYCVARLGATKDMPAAISACKGLISDESNLLSRPGVARQSGQTLAAAYDALAEVHLIRRDIDAARNELASGIRFATGDLQIKMLLSQAGIDKSLRDFNVTKCASIVKASHAFSLDQYGDPSAITFLRCYEVMVAMERAGRTREVSEFIDHLFTKSVTNDGVIELINETISHSVGLGINKLGLAILEKALDLRGGALSDSERFTVLSTLCSLSKEKAAKYAKDFLELFSLPGLERPEQSHVILLHNLATWSVEWRNRAAADLAVAVLSREPVGFEDMSSIERDSWDALRLFSRSIRDLAFSPDPGEIAKARSVAVKIGAMRDFSFANFPSAYVRTLQTALVSQLKRFNAAPEINKGRKVGRNQLVKVSYEGVERSGKYKTFLADLEAGRCTLL